MTMSGRKEPEETVAFDVAVVLGSARRGSLTRSVAEAIARRAAPDLAFEMVEIGGLPLFNPDLDEDGPPDAWQVFRQRIARCDAVLFATPEYNRSVPSVLKNAIDIGSRPSGKNVWNGKPGAIVTVSPGAIGGFGANHHLRQSLAFLNVYTMQQPEAYLSNAGSLLGDDGGFAKEATTAFVDVYLSKFRRWIETVTATEPASSLRVTGT